MCVGMAEGGEGSVVNAVLPFDACKKQKLGSQEVLFFLGHC